MSVAPSSLATLAFTESVVEMLYGTYLFLKVLVGFSVIIFVHELGHFIAAKRMGIRVDRFAVGFFTRVCGWRRGEGFTFGPRPEYRPEQLAEKGYGETDYCLNVLPFGGYVKMLGEDDIIINDATGEIRRTDDPRAFPNKSVGARAIVVSAGVICNLLFAILLYAFVFQFLGTNVMAPEIGEVLPGTPAARAGLRAGDRVLSVDGEPVRSFEEFSVRRVLADGPARLRVQREGLREPLELYVPLADRDRDTRDVIPSLTNELGRLPKDANTPLREGDRVVAVNGVPVADGYAIREAVLRSGGKPLDLTIERPGVSGSGGTTFSFSLQPLLELRPPASPADGSDPRVREDNLLGFFRRRLVRSIVPGSPAQRAGFAPGDVVLQWGSVANPTYAEIVSAITQSQGQLTPVVVERDGKRRTLEVAPRPEFSWRGSGTLRVGIEFGSEGERPVVADIAPRSPADQLGMPRGAEILSVAGQATPTWSAVFEALQAAAGTQVELRYRAGRDEVSASMRVPSSVVNELGIPPTGFILSIDGKDSVVGPRNRVLRLPEVAAVELLLAEKVGKTVEVEFLPSLRAGRAACMPFQVTADNAQPWQLRANYAYDMLTLPFKPKLVNISANGNPITAIGMAIHQTGSVVVDAYRFFRGLLRRLFVAESSGVGVEHVSGPIGIFRAAIMIADSGIANLFSFLAFISVQLAVINFLPLPVVDGGLMAFLLLERIRGKPLSVRVQVITTLAGLALIVLCFVLVTVQDIAKWMSGSI